MSKIIEIKNCQQCSELFDYYPSGCPLPILDNYQNSIHPDCHLQDREFPSEEEIKSKIEKLTEHSANFTDTSFIFYDEEDDVIEAYNKQATVKTLTDFANWLKGEK